MIELKIEGVCEHCPYRNLTLAEYDFPPQVRCKHDRVCRFIDDPHGAEKLEAAKRDWIGVVNDA